MVNRPITELKINQNANINTKNTELAPTLNTTRMPKIKSIIPLIKINFVFTLRVLPYDGIKVE